MASFAGKVVAITGGASGMGLAIARTLHDRGAKLSIADCNAENLAAATAAISSDTSKVMTYELDVRNLTQVRDWLVQTKEKFGRLDGAVNFAGVISHTMGSLVEDQDEEDWERIIGVDLTVSIVHYSDLLPHADS